MSNTVVDVIKLVEGLETSLSYEVQPLANNDEIVQVVVQDQDEFPINVSIADDELLCMVRLFDSSDIAEGKTAELHELLLSANLALPLSSFGKIGDDYMLLGALSVTSKPENILLELETLAGNTIEALELISDYLQ